MILDAIFNLVFGFLIGILDFLPNLDFTLGNSAYFSKASDIISTVMYFFPMGVVVDIVSISFVIICFRIGMSILKTIWDLIPFF